MKIIGKDNYARDSISDVLIADNVNKYIGEMIVDYLNTLNSSVFYDLVENDYKLYDASVLY